MWYIFGVSKLLKGILTLLAVCYQFKKIKKSKLDTTSSRSRFICEVNERCEIASRGVCVF